VSFGNEDKTGDSETADIKLMNYLAEHQHMTPFEYQHATFLIECPLFIRSQIHRHRAFSYNEISRRYTSDNLEFWVPDVLRGQSRSNRQASSDDTITLEYNPFLSVAEHGLDIYNDLLHSGVAREQARAVLPQSLLTKFYMGGNLRAWAHFIELRRDEHAQREIQIIAERIAAKLKSLWPNSCAALKI
jgi:thymidylate synthase (FAD)